MNVLTYFRQQRALPPTSLGARLASDAAHHEQDSQA
jgi:hypothetical protein